MEQKVFRRGFHILEKKNLCFKENVKPKKNLTQNMEYYEMTKSKNNRNKEEKETYVKYREYFQQSYRRKFP